MTRRHPVLLSRWQVVVLIAVAVAACMGLMWLVVAGVDWYFEKLFKRR